MSATVPVCEARPLRAPLRITRNSDLYARWWAQEANQPAIVEALELVTEGIEVEHGLHGLMLEVFQAEVGPVGWLEVEGLRDGVTIGYLNLDIDPAYDGEGILDGLEVVVNLWTTTPMVSLTVSAYVSRPRRQLVPQETADPEVVVAEVIDVALALINHEIAERDRFMFAARAPHPGGPANGEGHQLPEIVLSGYVSDVDGAPVVQIDTTEAARRVRVCINDGPVYDGDPTCDRPPGALGAQADGCHECGSATGLVSSTHGQACSLHPSNVGECIS